MSYSNRSRTYDYFDSLHPEEAATAAVRVINILKENPTPRGTELLRNFLRDGHKHLNEESTSTSEEKQLRIGKILVFLSKEIGKDNDGTVMYEGYYEDRQVAVKRLLQSHHTVVDREIKHLIKSDQYHNIVRYHGMESDRDFHYLAMEHCDCNLVDLIQIYSAGSYELVNNDPHCSMGPVTVHEDDRLGDVKLWEENKNRPSPLLLKLMRDVVSGLVALHALNIIHRDLKPKSILIIKEISTLCAKLSDMGFCRSWEDTGWKAPEQHLCGQQTRAMDMFSLGCILFFCITQGKHPFGEPDERDRNIKSNNKKNLLLIQDFPEAFHLISRLLEADDLERPKIAEVLQHPMFWGAKERLDFLHDTSDFLHDTSDEANNNDEFWNKIKNTRKNVFRGKWNSKVDIDIIKHGRQFIKRDFNFLNVPDLLRLIRNMFNHRGHLPSNIQTLVGVQYEKFDDYFTSRFPNLLIEVYKVVCQGYKEKVCGNFVCRYAAAALSCCPIV
ncbi:hypothetical protein TIFTF001_028218 [Ficus carica]|uniref:non-specific serine/threonine protein kinase n=1 Tax=Ficus carica TaxID=3494 RepID=A0AA88J161_FICCA|nr:hypothetical protein TIFTF001_028218 [Ficus carica]